MFADRTEAGDRLLAALPELDPGSTVIVALPRGGVPVAEVIARGIGAPLDILLVRKVGMPGRPELALAAVADGDLPTLSVNADVARMAGLGEADIRALARAEISEIDRRRAAYLGGRTPVPVRGKTVVLVDDGIATGATMRAALTQLRAREPARIILAVPVASPKALRDLADLVDDAVCLLAPPAFMAVGAHYRRFPQVPDETVAKTLAAVDRGQ